MVESIKVAIELEGGAEIDRQLAATAEAGKQMFADLQKAGDQIDFSTVSDQFQTVGKAISGAASAVQSAASFEVIIKGVKQVEGAFESLGNAVTKMATRMTRSMGILGVAARAFGPVGIAAGLMGASIVKGTLAAVNSLEELNSAASKLNTTVAQLDAMRQGFANLGVSGTKFTQFLGELEKADLERVKDALKEIEERNYGQGSAQLKVLQDAARGIGPAADAARAGLEKIGQPIPTGAEEGLKTITELVNDLGKAQGTQAFIAQLEKMAPGTDRLNFAMRNLGEVVGRQVVQALNEGKTAAEAFANVKPLTQEQVAAATQLGAALENLKIKWDNFGKTVEGSKALTSIFNVLATGLVQIEGGIAVTVEEFKALGSAIDTVATAGAAAIKFTADTIVDMGRIIAQVAAAIAGFTWDGILAGKAAWDAIVTAVKDAGTAISTFVSSLAGITWNAISSAGVAAWNAITGAIQGAINMIQAAIDKMLQFIGLRPSGGAPAPAAAPGNAAGGLLGGRGTGTSDSNLAWVSRGEHIMPARAVGQPGVLAFLEALRRSGGNLRGVLDGMGRFALGGMVPRPAMAFAGGGMVGGGANLGTLTLGLPSGGSVSVRASASVVDQLRQEAALAQVRSGGRKPSRYT